MEERLQDGFVCTVIAVMRVARAPGLSNVKSAIALCGSGGLGPDGRYMRMKMGLYSQQAAFVPHFDYSLQFPH